MRKTYLNKNQEIVNVGRASGEGPSASFLFLNKFLLPKTLMSYGHVLWTMRLLYRMIRMRGVPEEYWIYIYIYIYIELRSKETSTIR